MKVNWYIESYEGGEGVLTADVDGDNPVADIMNSKNGFQAYIYPHRYSSIRDCKTDASLIELMNWVEEELKFRSSHE
jgi:hypothetical protein